MRELSIRGLGAQVKLCSVDDLIHGEEFREARAIAALCLARPLIAG